MNGYYTQPLIIVILLTGCIGMGIFIFLSHFETTPLVDKETLNIGMALVGTGQVNTINKITTSVLDSVHQGNITKASLANGYVTQFNDTQTQIRKGTVLELQVSESNPICYPVVSYKNGTVLPLISTIT